MVVDELREKTPARREFEMITSIIEIYLIVTGYDAVLFDSDGILVTPPGEATQAAATLAAFSEVGVNDVSRRHIEKIVDGASIDVLQAICASYGVDTVEFWEAWEEHDERSQFAKFRSGVRTRYDDISVIAEISQPCGVVSNNHHSTIEFVLDCFGLKDLFETFYGREKTLESLDLQKPNSHYMERAVHDLRAESALYVGDSNSDIIAADRAGVDSVFVRRPHCTTLELTRTPSFEIDTLDELLEIRSLG